MKCFKCGAELTEDTKFCSYCGAKIEDKSQTPHIPKETVEENVIEEEFDAEVAESEPIYTQSPKNKSIADKVKDMFMSYWNKMDLFCKVETIVGAVAVLLLIISILSAKIIPILCSVLSIGGIAVAFLLYKGTIKCCKNWAKYLVLISSILIAVLNIVLLGNGIFNTTEKNVANDGVLVANSVFDEIVPIVTGDATIEPGTEYAFMGDAWNVYIAKAVTQDVIKIEAWHKTSQSDKTLEYRSDLGSFRITEEVNGFCWIDDLHTAFTFILQDKNNSDFKKPTVVVFTINNNDSNKYKGTNFDEKIACYSYANDDWHTDRAIALTDTLVKIECWYRTSSGFWDKHCYAWDVGLIDTENTSTDFAWGDEEHSAFTITMKDPQNDSYWKEEKLTSFILENKDYMHATVAAFLGLSVADDDTRNEKNGFDSKTNEVYQLARYTIEIPEYWKSENKIDGGIQRYAEKGGKVAMLQVAAQKESDDSYPVTFDGLMDDNDNMIEMIESTAFSEVTDYEVIDTGVVKGILYKGTIDNMAEDISGNGVWFAFASEGDRNWCTLIMCQSKNTEFLYNDDFMKILQSIKPIEERDVSTEKAETESEPEKPVSEYEKAYIRDMNNYDLYYMFDTDTNKVVYFGTNDTYIEKGTYTGDFASGVTISWSHGEWTEKFTHKSGNSATLIDGNGFDWEYKTCDIKKAQSVLDGLR